MKAFPFLSLACVLALGLTPVASAESLVGVTTTNTLVTFDSASPGIVVGSVGISGLQAGERSSASTFDPRP
jgi:hypothetical protein